MFNTVLVTNAVWIIGKRELKKYGGYENAKDALDLPDGFSIDVEETQDVDECVRVSAKEKYEYDLDTFDAEVIEDEDDEDDEGDDDDDDF